MIQEKLNPLWGTTAKDFFIDLAKHSIEVVLVTNSNGVLREQSLAFKKVSSFYFNSHNESAIIYDNRIDKAIPEIENWEVIDIAEIYFVPEMKKLKEHTKEIITATTDYNIILEIYSYSFFIKSSEIYVDNERIL